MANLILRTEGVLWVSLFFSTMWGFVSLAGDLCREYRDLENATRISLGPLLISIGALIVFKAWMFVGGE